MEKIIKLVDWDTSINNGIIYKKDPIDKAINNLTYPRLAPIEVSKDFKQPYIDLKRISHTITYMWTDEYAWYAKIHLDRKLPRSDILVDLELYEVLYQFVPIGLATTNNKKEIIKYEFITIVPRYMEK